MDKEIDLNALLDRADFQDDGKYYFTELTDKEREALRYAGIEDKDIVVDKNYKVGQEKDRSFNLVNEGSTADDKKANLSPDLQKSYDFWNKFNDNSKQTGVSYNIENVENKCLLVEAKKGEKTIFKGIDHGSRGFDVIKKDNSYEQPLEFFDLLVKKAKLSNPKTVIRIKNNVTDPVLRNKILIACAKNNATPVGNLPRGFDFEELKALVRRARTPEELDELIHGLYMQNEYAFGTSNTSHEADKKRVAATPAPAKNEKKANNQVVAAPVITPTSDLEKRIAEQQALLREMQQQLKAQQKNSEAQNQAAIAAAAQKASQQTVSKREGWWKRNLKKGLLYTALTAAVLFGFKKCNDKERDEKIADQTEQLTNSIQDLSIESCTSFSELMNERDSLLQRTKELEKAVEDCAKSKTRPAPVRRKTVRKKQEPIVQREVIIQRDTVQGEPVILPGKIIQLPDSTIPGKIIQLPDQIIPGKVIQEEETPVQDEQRTVLDGALRHEIDKDIDGSVPQAAVSSNQGRKALDSNGNHEISNETYTGFMETLAQTDKKKSAADASAQQTVVNTAVRKRILNSNVH